MRTPGQDSGDPGPYNRAAPTKPYPSFQSQEVLGQEDHTQSFLTSASGSEGDWGLDITNKTSCCAKIERDRGNLDPRAVSAWESHRVGCPHRHFLTSASWSERDWGFEMRREPRVSRGRSQILL